MPGIDPRDNARFVAFACIQRAEALAAYRPIPIRYDVATDSWLPVTQAWVDQITIKMEGLLAVAQFPPEAK